MAKAPRPVANDFETRVYLIFKRMQRHVLIGEVSLETRYPLATCEHHLEELVHRGALRHMTEEERKVANLHPLVVAYRLLDPQKFTLLSQLL